MIELLITYVYWILIYALEAKHDLNYKTIDGSEKLWDAGMFAVLHIGYAVAFTYFFSMQGDASPCLEGVSLGSIALVIRLNFHDGFINVFRGRNWCGKFSVDNDKDYWDMAMVWLYNKGIKPCYIKISLLISTTIFYYLFYIKN